MKFLILLMGAAMLISCSSIGKQAEPSKCTELNTMKQMMENPKTKNMYSLNGNTITLYATWNEMFGVRNSHYDRTEMTFLVADENCIIVYEKKRAFNRLRTGSAIRQADIPYNPNHHFYYVNIFYRGNNYYHDNNLYR